jgi:hypothetical protein
MTNLQVSSVGRLAHEGRLSRSGNANDSNIDVRSRGHHESSVQEYCLFDSMKEFSCNRPPGRLNTKVARCNFDIEGGYDY